MRQYYEQIYQQYQPTCINRYAGKSERNSLRLLQCDFSSWNRLGGIGLIATVAFVAVQKWFSRKSKSATLDTTQEIETENPSRPRTFSCARFYERFEKADPFEGQYDHWVISEPEFRKSAKDMTKDEILAEAGIKA